MAPDKPIPGPPKIVDVSHPGKSTPSASSRPIIITNRPVLRQDPMMLDDGSDELSTSRPITVSRVSKPVAPEPAPARLHQASTPSMPAAPDTSPASTRIAPLADPSPGHPSTASVQSAAVAASVPATNTIAEAAPASEEPVKGDTDKQLAPNQVLDEAKKKAEEQKAALLAEQEKVIDSKKYYLSIKASEGHHTNVWSLVALVLATLIGLLWLDLVLDAGIVKFGNVHALTHFFHSG